MRQFTPLFTQSKHSSCQSATTPARWRTCWEPDMASSQSESISTGEFPLPLAKFCGPSRRFVNVSQSTITLTPKDFKSEVKPTWCPGCGDFGVLNAIYNSLATLKLPPDQTVVVSGIGCSRRLPHFVETFGIHSLHVRALPITQGMKMARPDLTIVTAGADGDLFRIAAGHLV